MIVLFALLLLEIVNWSAGRLLISVDDFDIGIAALYLIALAGICIAVFYDYYHPLYVSQVGYAIGIVWYFGRWADLLISLDAVIAHVPAGISLILGLTAVIVVPGALLLIPLVEWGRFGASWVRQRF